MDNNDAKKPTIAKDDMLMLFKLNIQKTNTKKDIFMSEISDEKSFNLLSEPIFD